MSIPNSLTMPSPHPSSQQPYVQEYWNGLPFPPPGGLPDPGIELVSSALAGGFFTTEPPGLRILVKTIISAFL